MILTVLVVSQKWKVNDRMFINLCGVNVEHQVQGADWDQAKIVLYFRTEREKRYIL